MTPKAYRATLHLLGLGHSDMPGLFAVSTRQSSRYSAGERPVPPVLVVALGLCAHFQLFPEQARSIAELAGEAAIETLGRR
jgi:hypothetical protein